MAGGTHAFDMIKRMKQNEKLRKLPYFKRKQEYRAIEENLGIHYKTATPEEKELLRNELHKRYRQENKLAIITFLALFGFSIVVVVLILKFLLP